MRVPTSMLSAVLALGSLPLMLPQRASAGTVPDVPSPRDVVAIVDSASLPESHSLATTTNSPASIPTNPDSGVRLDANTGGDVSVGIPGDHTPNGVRFDAATVFPAVAPEASVVARATDQGAQVLTVIEGPSAPSRYRFRITTGGGTLSLDGRGGAVVAGGDGDVVATIEPAWAVDATGSAVPTRYVVDGQDLIQVVDHSQAHYPVIADPSVSLGWKIYTRYRKAEVHRIASNPLTDKIKYAAAICAAIPNPVAAAGCGLYIYDSYGSVSSTFENADRRHQCVEMQYLYNGLLVGWKRYSC